MAGVLTLPVAWSAQKERRERRKQERLREQGEPFKYQSPPPTTLIEAFKTNWVATSSHVVSLVFVIATAVLITIDCLGGKVTALELTFTYIAGAMFEVVGIWVTVDAVIDLLDGGAVSPAGWSKWLGPLLIVGGIVLGLVGNVASLHMQPHAPRPVVSVPASTTPGKISPGG